ncbi:MAG: hypothetical protein IJJ26_02775, partial [Victivallales bacterium]|nr:hypothetical protein [Victivallales bacterium]
GQITEAFGMTQTELETSPRNPICNVEPLVAHKIPMMAVVGQCDQTVNVCENFDKLESRIHELGGSITVERRNFWGHHPHGLDDPERLLDFHCNAL